MKNKDYILTEEEKELLNSFENNEFSEVENIQEEKIKTQKILKNTLKERKQVNLRIPTRDLHNIKKAAMQRGMPYQTLILSSLHQLFSQNKQLISV